VSADTFTYSSVTANKSQTPALVRNMYRAFLFFTGLYALGLVIYLVLRFTLHDSLWWLAFLHIFGPFYFLPLPVLMGLCRVLVYLAVGLAFAVPPPAVLWLGALLLLCYLIGLTYVAKQETLGEVRNLWPLLFLAAPVVYALVVAAASLSSGALFVLFTMWVGVALWFLKRRAPGDVPRAVVSLIAGIALLDAVLIAAAGAPGIAWLAVGGFVLTLALQRLVPGT